LTNTTREKILTPKTLKYFDLLDVMALIEKETGRDLRNWDGKESSMRGDGLNKDGTEKQDYWMLLCDRVHNLRNDSYVTIDFYIIGEDWYKDKPKMQWAIEISELFLKMLPKEAAEDPKYPTAFSFWVCW
jgi:hypothetical protein